MSKQNYNNYDKQRATQYFRRSLQDENIPKEAHRPTDTPMKRMHGGTGVDPVHSSPECAIAATLKLNTLEDPRKRTEELFWRWAMNIINNNNYHYISSIHSAGIRASSTKDTKSP